MRNEAGLCLAFSNSLFVQLLSTFGEGEDSQTVQLKQGGIQTWKLHCLTSRKRN
jgi:hypothetical protein